MLSYALLAACACAGFDHIEETPFFITITTWPPKKFLSNHTVLATASGYFENGTLDDIGPSECYPQGTIEQSSYYPTEQNIQGLQGSSALEPVVQQLLTDIDRVSQDLTDGTTIYRGEAEMSHASAVFNGDWSSFDPANHVDRSVEYYTKELSKMPEVRNYVAYQRDQCIHYYTQEIGAGGESDCPLLLEGDRTLIPSTQIENDPAIIQDWLHLILYLAIKHSGTDLSLFCSTLNPRLVNTSMYAYRDGSWQTGRCFARDSCDSGTLQFQWLGQDVLTVFQEEFNGQIGFRMPVWMLLNNSALVTATYDIVIDRNPDANEMYCFTGCSTATNLFTRDDEPKFTVSTPMICLPLHDAADMVGVSQSPLGDCSPSTLCSNNPEENPCNLWMREHLPETDNDRYPTAGPLGQQCNYMWGYPCYTGPMHEWYVQCHTKRPKCCDGTNSLKYFPRNDTTAEDSGYLYSSERIAQAPSMSSVVDLWWNRTYTGDFAWYDLPNRLRITFNQSEEYPANHASDLLPLNLTTKRCNSTELPSHTLATFTVRDNGETCMLRKVTLPDTSVQRWQTLAFASDASNRLASKFVCPVPVGQPLTTDISSLTAPGLPNEVTLAPVSPVMNSPQNFTDFSVSSFPTNPARQSQQTPSESSTRWWVIALVGSAIVVGGAGYAYNKKNANAEDRSRSRTVQYRKMSQA